MLWQLVEQLSRVPKKAKGRIIWNDGCRSRIYSNRYFINWVCNTIVALISMIIFTVVVFTIIVSKNLCLPLSIFIHNLQIHLTLRQNIHFKINKVLLAFCWKPAICKYSIRSKS